MLESGSAAIWLYKVRAERADDFESWFRTTAVPAAETHPELKGRWQVFRANEPEDGAVTYGFLFDGYEGDEWELEPLLADTYGGDEASRLLADMLEMVEEDYGWAMTPVVLA